jgi:hypothetical protein
MNSNEVFKMVCADFFGDPENILDTYKNGMFVFFRQLVKVFPECTNERPVGLYVLKLVRFEKCPVAFQDFLDVVLGHLLEVLPDNVGVVSAFAVRENYLGVPVERFVPRQLKQVHEQLVRAVIVITNSGFHFLCCLIF